MLPNGLYAFILTECFITMNLHRVNYPVIDREYTRRIRNELDNGRDVHVTLFTPDEVDFLLDMEDGENEGYVVDLVEEVFVRSHGLRLDLAVEGPANVNVASTTIEMENRHNVYMVSQNKGRIRRFDTGKYDSALVPRVSPQDANVATVSLDYSAGRPRVTRIEGLKLDTKSDPVETALTNALVSVQTLMSLGMDVDSLIDVVERIWGIDYVRELMNTAAFSPTGSIPDFLASGGRPAPSAYVSPNIMSMYQIVQRPTYDVDDSGVANLFLSRSALLTKFISCMTHMFVEGSALNLMTFSPNPAQFSRFDPTKISGTASVSVGSPALTSLRHMVAHLDSYEDYIEHRQSARAAVRAEKWTVERDMNAMAVAALKPNALSFASVNVYRSEPIMSMSHVKSIVVPVTSEDAAPSRLAAVAWGMFHNEKTPTMYKTLLEIRICMLGWCLLETDPNKVSSWWREFSHVPGIASVLSGMNVARFANNSEVMALMSLPARGLDSAGLWVMFRIANMLRESVCAAFDSAISYRDTGKLPLSMDPIKPYRIGTLFRSIMFANEYLSKVMNVAPFKYSKSVTAAIAEQLSHRGALRVSTKAIAHSSKSYDEWLGYTKNSKVSEAKSAEARTRQLFSIIKADWSNYYYGKAVSIDNTLKYLNKVQSFADVRLIDVEANMPHTRGYQHVFASGLLAEIVLCHGRALAYKFVSVTLNVDLGASTGKDATKETFERYIEFLKSVTLDAAMDAVTVDLHIDKLLCAENSHAKKALNKSVSDIMKRSWIFTDCADMIEEAIVEAYETDAYVVGRTVREAVRSDWISVNDGSDIESKHEKVEERKENELISDREIAICMSFSGTGARDSEVNHMASIVYNLRNIADHMTSISSEYSLILARECESTAALLEMNPKCDALTRCHELVREFEYASARMDGCMVGDQLDFVPDNAVAKLKDMVAGCVDSRKVSIIK